MKWIIAAFLFIHGIAHLVGFISTWRLAEMDDMPYKTTLFAGRIDVGDAGIRVIGVLWLLAAVVFVIVALGVVMQAGWWLPELWAVSVFSLMLSALSWPEARIGVFVNLTILLYLFAAERFNWWLGDLTG